MMWPATSGASGQAAKATVERLMRLNRWLGVRPQMEVRSMIPDPAA